MSKAQPGYRSYFLRLWEAYTEGELVWRASLESPHSRQRRGFASLADLFAFLESEVGDTVQSQAAPNVYGEGGDDHR